MAKAVAQFKPKPPSATTKSELVNPIENTTKGLRQAIVDDINALRRGEITPTRVNAMTKAVTAAVETLRAEIEIYKITSTMVTEDGSRDEEAVKSLITPLL